MLTEEELLAQPDDNYMDEAQIEFFRARLLAVEAELLERISSYKEGIKDAVRAPDEADFASNEESRTLSLRMLALEREKLVQVSRALVEIDSGDYGYCHESGEPIGLRRLLISPESLYSVDTMRAFEARQRHTAQAHG